MDPLESLGFTSMATCNPIAFLLADAASTRSPVPTATATPTPATRNVASWPRGHHDVCRQPCRCHLLVVPCHALIGRPANSSSPLSCPAGSMPLPYSPPRTGIPATVSMSTSSTAAWWSADPASEDTGSAHPATSACRSRYPPPGSACC